MVDDKVKPRTGVRGKQRQQTRDNYLPSANAIDLSLIDSIDEKKKHVSIT